MLVEATTVLIGARRPAAAPLKMKAPAMDDVDVFLLVVLCGPK
jgi:hypothetical protein